MGGKNEPKCIVAKFGDIKTRITDLMDTVAAKIGIEEYGIHQEMPENYGKMAMVKKMAKLWITVVKKGVGMDKEDAAKVLGMMQSVMAMAESKLMTNTAEGTNSQNHYTVS